MMRARDRKAYPRKNKAENHAKWLPVYVNKRPVHSRLRNCVISYVYL